MSIVSPFHLQKGYEEYVEDRVERLIRVDEFRVMELLESIQYGLGYLFVGFFMGVGTDMLFPVYTSEKDAWTVFSEVISFIFLLISFNFSIQALISLTPKISSVLFF